MQTYSGMGGVMAADEYEFIVVGAGSAGCILASRLSEDASVLLIEAGPMDAPANSFVPDQAPLLMGSSYDWGYKTTPQAALLGRSLLMPHGFLVGGSSSINGMLWTRGDPTDFDAWAQAGAPGWSYADLEPYFRRVEGYAGENAPHLGHTGPLYLENLLGHGVNPASLDFVAAAEARGHRRVYDFSRPEGVAGAGVVTVNVRDGRRFGAREAYLEPALSRDRLKLWADTRAIQVNFKGSRCVGVTVRRGGVSTVVRATREVVLAASAVETPKLLKLSGVGPEPHLQSIGIPVRHALAGVGANFHDHASVGFQFTTAREVPLTNFVFDSALFFRSQPDWIGADLETLCYVRTFQNGKLVAGLAMRTGLVRPMSRGTIRLRSSDPTEPPLLDPRLLSVDSDGRRLAIGVRESLAIAATAPMDQWIAGLDTTNLRHLGFSDGGLREDMAWTVCESRTSASCRHSCRDTPKQR